MRTKRVGATLAIAFGLTLLTAVGTRLRLDLQEQWLKVGTTRLGDTIS